jgi:hypothetical protein
VAGLVVDPSRGSAEPRKSIGTTPVEALHDDVGPAHISCVKIELCSCTKSGGLGCLGGNASAARPRIAQQLHLVVNLTSFNTF